MTRTVAAEWVPFGKGRDVPEQLPLTGPHWDFAIAVYSTVGVADGCLRLQDDHAVNVPVLLMALFAAHRGVNLEPSDIQAADSLVSSWHEEVVAPLRAVRRRLKMGFQAIPHPQVESFRTYIKAAELRAEQFEIALLTIWIASLPQERIKDHADLASAARAVVQYYSDRAVRRVPPEIDSLVADIAAAASRVGRG